MKGLAAWLLVAVMTPAAWALTPQDATLTADQEARYRTLIHEFRCLVCQNQTIADSNAELATDLRNQVHQRIASGESDDDIRRYVTDRYGDFVLYKPPMSWRTVLLWAGPFILLLVGLVTAARFARRRSRVPAAAAADPERLQRLLKDEDR